MQCDLKKILLTTCCLTLSACGGAGVGPIFSIDPATPTVTTTTVDGGFNYEEFANFAKTQTFRASSVVMDYVHHEEYNKDLYGGGVTRTIYPFVNPGVDPTEIIAGAEANPTMVPTGGTATMHFDTSDNSFNLTINQGNVDYFHNYLETERDTSVTDKLSYESIDDKGNGNFLYTLDISKPGTALNSHPNLVLSYMSFGMWGAQAYPVPVSGSRDTHGGIAFGVETLDKDMPTSGEATYSGATFGYLDVHAGDPSSKDVQIYDMPSYLEALLTDPLANIETYRVNVAYHREYTLLGDAAISVNFTAMTLRANMTNMMKTDILTGVSSAWYNFHSSLSLISGSNSFSGTASTDSPYLHGTLMGTFYGPVTSGFPEEVGGIWSLYDSADQSVRAVGSFGAKRD